MPCYINGQYNAVGRGACEAGGGSWVEDLPDVPATSAQADFQSLRAKEAPKRERGALDMLQQASYSMGDNPEWIPIGGTVLIKLLKKGAPGLKRVGKQWYQKAKDRYTSQTIQRPAAQYHTQTSNLPANVTSSANIGQLAADATIGGMVGTYLYDKYGSQADVSVSGTPPLSTTGANADGLSAAEQEKQLDTTNKVDTDASKEKQGEQALSILEQMKTKDYWMKPMSGAPGDTRLSRIGQLISEMGTAPHLRKGSVSDDFAKRANEAGAINQRALAALQTTPDSAVGELSIDDIATRIRPQVASAMGKNKWTQLDPSEENVEAAAIDIAGRAQERELKFKIPFSEALADILKLQEATGWSGYNI